MRRRSFLVLASPFLAGVLAVACAEAGVEGLDEDDVFEPIEGDAGTDAETTRPDSGPVSPPRDSGASSSGESSSSGGESSSSGGESSSSGGGSTSSSGGSSSGGTVGEPDVCAGTGSCSAAPNLGQIYSDYGEGQLTASDNKSKLVSFTTYDDGLTAFVDHSYAVRFTPADGATYELRLRQCDGLNCNPCSSNGTVIPPNQYNSFAEYWGDTLGPGDHRTVVLEVRQTSGSCPSGSNWRLQIIGNVP